MRHRKIVVQPPGAGGPITGAPGYTLGSPGPLNAANGYVGSPDPSGALGMNLSASQLSLTQPPMLWRQLPLIAEVGKLIAIGIAEDSPLESVDLYFGEHTLMRRSRISPGSPWIGVLEHSMVYACPVRTTINPTQLGVSGDQLIGGVPGPRANLVPEQGSWPQVILSVWVLDKIDDISVVPVANRATLCQEFFGQSNAANSVVCVACVDGRRMWSTSAFVNGFSGGCTSVTVNLIGVDAGPLSSGGNVTAQATNVQTLQSSTLATSGSIAWEYEGAPYLYALLQFVPSGGGQFFFSATINGEDS